jgi:hypothetical protein
MGGGGSSACVAKPDNAEGNRYKSLFIREIETTLPEISDAIRDDFAKLEQVAEINGFTKHGINQALNRGVSPSAILDAVTNPPGIKERADGSAQYIGSHLVDV